MKVNSKERQIELLENLVNLTFAGILRDPITPIPLDSGDYALYLNGQESLKVRWISDFDALCEMGYLDFNWNRMSTAKLYSLTAAGIRAVNGDMRIEEYAGIFPFEKKESTAQLLKNLRQLSPGLRAALQKVAPKADLIDISLRIAYLWELLAQSQVGFKEIKEELNYFDQLLFTLSKEADELSWVQQVTQARHKFIVWSQVVYQILERR